MALTEQTEETLIVNRNGSITRKQYAVLYRDGVEISCSAPHTGTVDVEDDTTPHGERLQAVALAAWTPSVKANRALVKALPREQEAIALAASIRAAANTAQAAADEAAAAKLIADNAKGNAMAAVGLTTTKEEEAVAQAAAVQAISEADVANAEATKAEEKASELGGRADAADIEAETATTVRVNAEAALAAL